MTNIYDLTWTDPTIITTFAVCPGCNSEMMLIYEDADGRQEWHCDECWQAFDADGKRLHAVNFGGIAMRCPECGDRRISRDPHSGQHYCKGCRTTYFDLKTEAIRDQSGQITGGRVVDYGEPDHARNCPNCGDALRVQVFDLIGGDSAEGYTCQQCDLTYRRDDDGHLIPFPECPRCGGKSLVRYGDIRKCRFCSVKTDLEGHYLNPTDAPGKGEVQAQAKEYNVNPAAADNALG